jgi:cytoskeleton protein RodZ
MSKPLKESVENESENELEQAQTEKQAQTENKEEIKPQPVDIGAKLVKARENQNLTIEDIAARLNLTVKVIAQLESNQFNQDLPLTFVRGYLRSYAQKVGVDTETLTAEFDQQTQVQEKSIQKIKSISSFKSSRRREVNSNNFAFKMLTFMIVIALLSFAGWEAWKRYGANALGANSGTSINQIELNTASLSDTSAASDFQYSPAQGEDFSDADQNINVDQTPDAAQTLDASQSAVSNEELSLAQSSFGTATNGTAAYDSAVTQVVAENNELSTISDSTDSAETTQAQAEVTSQEQPISDFDLENAATSEVKTLIALTAENSLTTEFVFTADCWVKITDANDDVLAIGVKRSGKIMPLEGVAPFNVTLGNPAAVQLTVEGLPYDLTGFSAGRTAKFELSKN